MAKERTVKKRVSEMRPLGDRVRSGRRVRTVVLCVGGVVVLGLGGAAVMLGAGRSAQPAAKRSGPGSLDIAEATKQEFTITTTATGELRAAKQVDIKNTLDSETTVVEIVPEGSSVKAGQVLIRLNSESIQQRLDEEKLQLESAKAQVVEAEQGYQIQISENDSARRASELKVALARLEFDQWRDGELMSRQQELDHNLDRAEKEEERLGDKYHKSGGLFEKGYYSFDQLQQDELAWEQAVNVLNKARLDKEVYWDFEYPKQRKRKESDVGEALAELDRVQRQNASRIASKEASLNNSRQVLTIREQKYAKYESQLKGATIVAPSDGLVVYATSMDNARWGGDDGPLQVGSKVYPNQNMIILPDTSEMVAAVRVHESLASRIRKGQTASVKVEAAGGERYTGKVESIGILAEQTSRWMDPNLREYTVRILLDLPKGEQARLEAAKDSESGQGEKEGTVGHALKPSMRCEAEVQLGMVKAATTVPIQAVFNEGPMRYVHVPEGARFVRRPVLLGQRSDKLAEVKVGLEVGERVLLRKPEAGEVVVRPWDEKELAAVGLKLDEGGQIVADGSKMQQGAGGAGGPGRGPAGGAGARVSKTLEAAKSPAVGAVATAEKPASDGSADEKKPDDGAEPKKDGVTTTEANKSGK